MGGTHFYNFLSLFTVFYSVFVCPINWRGDQELNPGHSVLETDVLPTELSPRGGGSRNRTDDLELAKLLLYQRELYPLNFSRCALHAPRGPAAPVAKERRKATGPRGRNRTSDRWIIGPLLYQLSYSWR